MPSSHVVELPKRRASPPVDDARHVLRRQGICSEPPQRTIRGNLPMTACVRGRVSDHHRGDAAFTSACVQQHRLDTARDQARCSDCDAARPAAQDAADGSSSWSSEFASAARLRSPTVRLPQPCTRRPPATTLVSSKTRQFRHSAPWLSLMMLGQRFGPVQTDHHSSDSHQNSSSRQRPLRHLLGGVTGTTCLVVTFFSSLPGDVRPPRIETCGNIHLPSRSGREASRPERVGDSGAATPPASLDRHAAKQQLAMTAEPRWFLQRSAPARRAVAARRLRGVTWRARAGRKVASPPGAIGNKNGEDRRA